jgi:hypothetical protein
MASSIFWILLATATLPQSSQSEDLPREFREIEAERSRALKAADLPAIERLYAEDFVGVSASGAVLRKKELTRAFGEEVPRI